MELTEKQRKDISCKILDCFPESVSFKDFVLILSPLIATIVVDSSKQYSIPDKDLTKLVCDNITRMVKIIIKKSLTQQARKSNTNT